MKISFNSFDCELGTSTERFVLVHCDNYRDFVKKFHLDKDGFMPDLISSKMNFFLFIEDGLNWNNFIADSFIYAGIEIHTSFNFNYHVNLELCYPCNQRMLDYLYYPERRMELFLYDSRNHDAAILFRDQLYGWLTIPHVFSTNSLESFKNFWIKCSGNKTFNDFPTRYKPILSKLSFWFPKTYRWVYHNIIEPNSFFSSRFHNDFISFVNFSTHKFDECEFNNCELPF